MPANWLDNLPEDIRSSSFPCNVHNAIRMEHILKLTTPSDNQDHTRSEVSISELPKSSHASDEQLKVLFCPYSFLGIVKLTGHSKHNTYAG
jgi:hypothetical protein